MILLIKVEMNSTEEEMNTTEIEIVHSNKVKIHTLGNGLHSCGYCQGRQAVKRMVLAR